MKHPLLAISTVIPLALLLGACHNVKYEGDIPVDEGMDPGVRQVMMEEEYQYPQEEFGFIPSPSDQLKMF